MKYFRPGRVWSGNFHMRMKNKNWKIKLGIAFIIACIPFFLVLPLIPFLEIENNVKITLSTVFLVIGEVLFWAGGLLVGKELLTKYKSYLHPKNWFKKETDEGKRNESVETKNEA